MFIGATSPGAEKRHQPPQASITGFNPITDHSSNRVNPRLHAIARRFTDGHAITEIAPLGKGLINATYRVATESMAFVLQRINSHVFPKPELLMSNLQQLGGHIRQQPPSDVHLQIPAIILSNDRQTYFLDEDRQFWRALELIHPAESREQISRESEAEQVGFALANFHRLCSNLPTEQLHDTLPGFHITPNYFRNYQTLIQLLPQLTDHPHSRYCREFIDGFRDWIEVLERAKQQGALAERVIHGDPKLNNFLFEPNSDHIVSLIDLDTVKPGLVHYDIGDCLRSCCHISDGNRFDLDCCKTIMTSYLQEAGHFFTEADYDYLYAAILLIPFELGLRFFSDYLVGNSYFKTSDPEQNLRRALAQFQLCENIASQRIRIEQLIKSIRPVA